MNIARHLINMLAAVLLLTVASSSLKAQEYATVKDLSFCEATDPYMAERCKLDIYYPTAAEDKGFPTLIWFHGGGLTSKEKELPALLMNEGFAVVSPDYRLSPQASCPSYIEDAAAAVAWTLEHIAEYGGDPKKVYVSGHSAGGYLSLILAMDKEWLGRHGIDADTDIAGYLPVSGQTVTHYTIRAEQGLPEGIPSIDRYAPIYHARANTARILLITGDRRLEMANRWEENALFQSVCKNLGNQNIELYELQGFNHGTVGPGSLLIVNTLRQWEKEWGLKIMRKRYPQYFK